ncbi:3-dehydroquinate synthase [Salibacterium halotolerans]|uniref:3-dehydroquinate synthase n=1 Tax=Salibacterium halotolerans TaxID=1884432 RepID=A0A1I5Q6C9_9BACI|nr:3-dehydroquinate synthase [Salibacterium halotolerans]SFP41782.1 3-dehydroquinate synthase [Salibacterium halotolerans]
MEKLIVDTSSREYPVYIGEGLLHQSADLLAPVLEGKTKALVISDSNTAPLYAETVRTALEPLLPVHLHTLPAGEQSKSLEEYEQVMTACIHAGLDRHSVILALGGGMIGDLAGFAAATYMRGISFVQVPTTLLAQDSSVGGKTGINHPLGKNLIGAFHQPEAVLYDTDTLSSLPDKEWRSGFAEMIKHAFIKDSNLLSRLRTEVQSTEDMKKESLKQFLRQSMTVKADIVKEDERETGVRAFLNYGHTLGHAMEKASGYNNLTHGEAVAAGMIFAMKLSNYLQYSNWDIAYETAWFTALGYPVEAASAFEPAALVETMKNDKKARAGELTFVLASAPERPFLAKVKERDILHLLLEMKKGGS